MKNARKRGSNPRRHLQSGACDRRQELGAHFYFHAEAVAPSGGGFPKGQYIIIMVRTMGNPQASLCGIPSVREPLGAEVFGGGLDFSLR